MNFTLSTLFRCIFSCLLALPVAVLATDNLTVQNTTYTSGTTLTVQAVNSITATPSVVINNGANITFQSGGHLSLGPGFQVNSGGIFQTAVGQVQPYVVGFETAQGFSLGSIGGQRGWVLTQGSAAVVNTDYYDGSQSLTLQTGSTAATVQQGFLNTGAPAGVTYLDFYIKPVAATNAASSSLVVTESAQVGFQIVGSQAEVYVFDGYGANTWLATGYYFAINGGSQATSWLHLTLREDYVNKIWDLYADGSRIYYDLAFGNLAESYFQLLTLQGVTGAATFIDAISVLGGPTVPTSGAASAVGSLGATLSWTASTTPSPATIAGYNVYRNGVQLNSTLITGTTYTDNTATSGTAYSYAIAAVDSNGLVSGLTSAIPVTTAASFEIFTPLH